MIDPGEAERIAAAVARLLPAVLASWFDARFVRSDRLFGGVATYRVTELVPTFLRTAQRRIEARFPEVPCLTFAALDMNQPFAPQGVAPESVSIVYAVNTLHVAHDLASTLVEVRRAPQPGGQLIVAECIRPAAGQSL